MSITPLPSIRAAEPYERLREASDAQFAKTGERPKICLVNLGAAADFGARAAFAKNFFAAGGIEAVANDGSATAEAARAAFVASEAKLACLCSSDETYQNLAGPIVEGLHGAGARAVYVAARPDSVARHFGDAVTAYVFEGCDALAVLQDALEKVTP